MTAPRPGNWVSARVDQGYRTAITARSHELIVDEPLDLGGTDAGMTPYELLLASLSSCMALTMRMYADHKGWPLEGASIHLRTAPARQPDHAVVVQGVRQVTQIERRIELRGPLDEEQRARLHEIADRCPIKRHLEAGLKVTAAS
jgi:putative redox protein